MANTFEHLEGEFHWIKAVDAEKSPFTLKGEPDKYAWKTMFRPNQESLLKIMDLQSKGVKNKLSKDEAGYYVNFSRPTEIKTGKGPIKLDPPKIYAEDGATAISGNDIGNGSKGKITLEIYEHKTPNGGKSHAARWYAATITNLVSRTAGAEAPPAYDQ